MHFRLILKLKYQNLNILLQKNIDTDSTSCIPFSLQFHLFASTGEAYVL